MVAMPPSSPLHAHSLTQAGTTLDTASPDSLAAMSIPSAIMWLLFISARVKNILGHFYSTSECVVYIWVSFPRMGILAILGELFEKCKRSLCENQER